MEAVDGNAIGGLLLEVFGTEMTNAATVCGSCGAAGRMAELVVYLRAPGTVVRCPTCDNLLMVFVTVYDNGLDRVPLPRCGPGPEHVADQVRHAALELQAGRR
jgi:hypothetical protein